MKAVGFTSTCSKRLHATFHLHMKKKGHSLSPLFFFFNFFLHNYRLQTRSTQRPVNHANLAKSWIKIIFSTEQKEGKNKQGKVHVSILPPPPQVWPTQQQLSSCAHHLLFLLEGPTHGQESEDSIQILIKIQDFSFYCIRCLTTIILIGKKFIYTNKLTLNHKALLFVFKL